MKKLLLFILLLPVFGYSQEYHSTKQAVVFDQVDTLYYTFDDVSFQIVQLKRSDFFNESLYVGFELNMYVGSNMYSYDIYSTSPDDDELGKKFECFDKVFQNKIDFIMSDDNCIYVRSYKALNRRKYKVVKIVKYFL